MLTVLIKTEPVIRDQLTHIIDELFELSFVQTIGILWGVDDLIQTASCTQLHDDHLVLVLYLCNKQIPCEWY